MAYNLILLVHNYNLLNQEPISRNIDDDFEHLVAHAMSCTLEGGAECTMGYGVLRFGSLNEVINNDDLGCLSEGKVRSLGGFEGYSTHRA